MSRASRTALAGAVALVCAPLLEARAQIRAAHPRIYLTPESVLAMQARWADRSDSELNEVVGYAARRLANPSSVDAELAGNYPDTVVLPTALAAVVTGEARFVDASLHYLEVLLAIDPPSGGDTPWRNRLLAMSVIYDWLYAELSAPRRTSAKDAIVAHMNLNHEFVASPDFVSGHSRWGNVTSLAGCIALHAEDNRITSECSTVVDNWTQGYVPALDYFGAGGGHHMGWMYGSAYSNVEPMLMWWSATGELWNESFLRDAAYFSLYAVDEAFSVPASGDAFGVYFTSGLRGQVAMSASFGQNPFAEHLARALPAAWGPHAVIRSIVKNDITPTPPDSLPKSRHFTGSGFVTARSTWAGVPALMVFKSTPFYSYNHHHRDENAVTLSYKGALLSDGGFYDAYGSSHHQNFFTRSIAHSTLLVHLPGESFRGWANDGGQRIPTSWAEEPTDMADLVGAAKLDGIEHYVDRGGVVWARGNASKAYVSTKVSSYLRDVLFVPTPDDYSLPVMLVVDRVALPSAREARIAWQLALAPALDGTTSAGLVSSGGGHARLHFLAPEERTLRSFSEAQRYTVDGVSYPPTTESTGTPTYWGRLEVVAPPALATTFSTAVVVSDAPLEPSAAPTVERIAGASWEGARVGGTLLVVVTSAVDEIAVDHPQAAVHRVFVAGLSPNQTLSMSFSDLQAPFTADTAGLVAALNDWQPPAPDPLPPSLPAKERRSVTGSVACAASGPGAELTDALLLVAGLAAIRWSPRRARTGRRGKPASSGQCD